MAAKTGANKRKYQQPKTLLWAPACIGFVAGMLVMFLHLKYNIVAPDQHKAAVSNAENKSTTPAPVFDFYTMLPETEVVVEVPKKIHQAIVTSPPLQQPKQATTGKPIAKTSYLLQAGSFKNLPDADGFKARLALLGIESKIQTVTIDNKDTWHRVQVGPIIGRDQASTLQQQLRQTGIDTLLMRAKHG